MVCKYPPGYLLSIHVLYCYLPAFQFIRKHAFDENGNSRSSTSIHLNSHSPSIKIWHETRKGVKINSAKYTLGQRRGVTRSSKGTIIYLPFIQISRSSTWYLTGLVFGFDVQRTFGQNFCRKIFVSISLHFCWLATWNHLLTYVYRQFSYAHINKYPRHIPPCEESLWNILRSKWHFSTLIPSIYILVCMSCRPPGERTHALLEIGEIFHLFILHVLYMPPFTDDDV